MLIEVVNQVGLDGESIVKEASQETSQQLLNEDFALARSLGVRGFPTIIIINEENKGVKIVGSRPFEYYVKGLEQILATEELQALALPTLDKFLEKEGLLFSREIEEMYDLEPNDVLSFIQKVLPADHYQQKEILDEMYIQKN